MEIFQRHPTVLQTPDGKRIIRDYNKVAKVLMKFEVIYHREWLHQISQLILIKIFLKEKIKKQWNPWLVAVVRYALTIDL